MATLAAGALVLHLAELALAPFVLAAVVGFVLDPAIRWLQARTGRSRRLVAGLLYLVIAAGVLALSAAVALDSGRDAARLAESGPNALHQMLRQALGPHGVQLFGRSFTADGVSAAVEGQAGALLSARTLVHLLPPVFALAVGAAALALLSFYAMVSGPRLAQGALWLVPPSRRPALERVLPQMTTAVQRYFIGVSAVAGFTMLMAWIGYGLVLHVRGAALLSIAVGLLETVPAVGPAVAAVLATLAALQLHSLAAMALMIGYAVALRLCIDDLIAPVVLGKSILVHPVVVMLAYLLGAVLFGLVGVLLAVPAAACIRIALTAAYEGDDGRAA